MDIRRLNLYQRPRSRRSMSDRRARSASSTWGSVWPGEKSVSWRSAGAPSVRRPPLASLLRGSTTLEVLKPGPSFSYCYAPYRSSASTGPTAILCGLQ